MSSDLKELADRIEARVAEAAKKYGFIRAAVHYDEAPIVITALRSYAAAQEQAPVAFMFWNEPDTQRHFTQLRETIGSYWQNVKPLYTAPQKPQPAPSYAAGFEAGIKAAKEVADHHAIGNGDEYDDADVGGCVTAMAISDAIASLAQSVVKDADK